MLKTVHRSAVVFHSAQQMFDLVNDIPSYPEFLPWCAAAEVLTEREDPQENKKETVAKLSIAKGALRHEFTTRNIQCRPKEIAIDLVEGPFSELQGLWSFKALEAEACKINFELSFKVSNRLIALALNPVFEHASNTMMDAFCQRADQIYRSN